MRAFMQPSPTLVYRRLSQLAALMVQGRATTEDRSHYAHLLTIERARIFSTHQPRRSRPRRRL